MPLPKQNYGLSAADDLGLGDMLGQQVADETDEMRKKRLAQLQQNQSGAGSPASMMLFGGGLGGGLGA